jgi:O-methyltransferase involved in polyketide biosynthesis
MTEIEDVIRTAFIVAEYRARENAEQNLLYRDPIVPLFLSELTWQAADRIAAGFPPGSARAISTIDLKSSLTAAADKSSSRALVSTPVRHANTSPA